MSIEVVRMERDYYKGEVERLKRGNPAMVSLVNIDYMDLYNQEKDLFSRLGFVDKIKRLFINDRSK